MSLSLGHLTDIYLSFPRLRTGWRQPTIPVSGSLFHQGSRWWNNNHSVRVNTGTTMYESMKGWANGSKDRLEVSIYIFLQLPWESLNCFCLILPAVQTDAGSLGPVPSLRVKENRLFGNSTGVEWIFSVCLRVAWVCAHARESHGNACEERKL